MTSYPVTAVTDEHTLIAATKGGSLPAYRRLYEMHVAMVYGLACRLVRDRAAAEDVTQEVFIKVWKDIRNFRGDSKFATWLHRVCSLTAITYLRRQRGWLKRVVLGDEAMPEIADPSLSEADLETCIKRLPERARVVFVLHAIEGYRHEDIAALCGIAVGSSKAHLHRARQLLEEWMTHER
jgi:RNA polymerase sigma-70 factor, ECF subfamily